MRLAVRERSRNGGEHGSIEEITVQLKHPVGERAPEKPLEAAKPTPAMPASKTIYGPTGTAPMAAAFPAFKKSKKSAAIPTEPAKLVLRAHPERASTPKKKNAMTS